MKFSKELVDKAELYLNKKTGKKSDKGNVQEFLRSIAELGKLLANNAEEIRKES